MQSQFGTWEMETQLLRPLPPTDPNSALTGLSSPEPKLEIRTR